MSMTDDEKLAYICKKIGYRWKKWIYSYDFFYKYVKYVEKLWIYQIEPYLIDLELWKEMFLHLDNQAEFLYNLIYNNLIWTEKN